jgi:hypothetical protein
MTSAHPIPLDALVEKVRAFADECGGWPSVRAVMRACSVGAPRATAALEALRAEGFDPTRRGPVGIVPDAPETHPEEHPQAHGHAAPEPSATATTDGAQTDGEPLVTAAADTVAPAARRVPRWPLLIIAAGAFVAIWSGWVGLGRLTGFGSVALLPGIADEWVINSAITLPLGVEAYAAFALWVWLSDAPVAPRARRFARWSALGALTYGAAGQIAYHLLNAAGMAAAPWQITVLVACLPVVVLGCGAALVHLIQRQEG